jgi:hypothetical protein
MNIRFEYLYRDGSNYKKWGEVVFSDPDAIDAEPVSKQLRKLFLVDGLFIAHQVRVPEVFLSDDDSVSHDDHCYHEFSHLEATPEPPNDKHGRSIRELVLEVERQASRGWQAFDPGERELRQSAGRP